MRLFKNKDNKDAEHLRKKVGLRCYLNIEEQRPCKICKKHNFNSIKFGDGNYEFYTALSHKYWDGEMAVTARVCGRSFDCRMESLQGEVIRELRNAKKSIIAKKKFGMFWQLINLADLGRNSLRYAMMLRTAFDHQEQRPATACEILSWMSSHKDDMMNCKTDLRKHFGKLKHLIK